MSEIFQGQLGNYTVVPTEDGGPTIFSEFFQEHCHSLSGSRQETTKIYLQNTGLLAKARERSPLFLLEVGTGPGLGLEMTLEALQTQLVAAETTLSYVGVELDADLFMFGILKFAQLGKLVWTRNQLSGLDFFLGHGVGVTAMVLIGDARQTLPLFHQLYPTHRFSFIYQDPFSPPKNPTLWTKEWFELLKQVSSLEVTLSTYSSSASMRKAMVQTGWAISNGGGFGKKRSSTIAKLQGSSCPDVLLHLEKSPAAALQDTPL